MAGPYKQQNNGTLGGSAVCPTCPPDSTQISLCYSNISADDLCCGSPVARNVYIATGTTWETAPGYFQDSNLTIPVANGWYSGDIIGCGSGPGPQPEANYSATVCATGAPIVVSNTFGCDGNPLTVPFLNLSAGQVVNASTSSSQCTSPVCVQITGITFANVTYYIDEGSTGSQPFNSCLTCQSP